MRKRRTLLMFMLSIFAASVSYSTMAQAYEINIGSSGSGSVAPAGVQTVAAGGNLDVTATAGSGACIADMTVSSQTGTSSGVPVYEGSEVSIGAAATAQSYTHSFSNVNNNHKLDVKFSSGSIKVTPKICTDLNNPSSCAVVPDAQWTATVGNDLGDAVAGGASVNKQGQATIHIPADFPCGTRVLVFQFGRKDGYYAPGTQVVYVAEALLSGTPYELEALYDPNTQILESNIFGVGRVDLSNQGENYSGNPEGTQSAVYYATDQVTLTASETSGDYYFQKWSGGVSGLSVADTKKKTITVTMNTDRYITAVFAQGCVDADGDKYYAPGPDGTLNSCSLPSGANTEPDCDDSNPNIYPGAPEICGDGVDQNCDGLDKECDYDSQDKDGDGFSPYQGDCEDNNPLVAPSMYDDPSNGVDEDCYGGAKSAGVELTNVEISNVPVHVKQKSAPPLIMFLLDDSGSMDWEYIIKGKSSFVVPGVSGTFYMVFPTNTSQTTSSTYNRPTATNTSAQKSWQVTWSGYNTLYFNGLTPYKPWPYWEQVYTKNPDTGASISGASIRSGENSYDPLINIFPNNAFEGGFTHAHMDYPRANTLSTSYVANTANRSAMYHPGGTTGSTAATYQIALNTTYTTLTRDSSGLGSGSVIVPYAHYYALYDNNGNGTYESSAGDKLYLITIPGVGGKKGDYRLEFYEITVNGVMASRAKQIAASDVPESIMPKRYYASAECSGASEICRIKDPEELAYVLRQDFANWYSFYRRRMLAAKAAIGLTVYDMKSASLGIIAINKRSPNIPLTYIAEQDDKYKMKFLAQVYNYRASGGTALRSTLYYVGKYFERAGTGTDLSTFKTAADPTIPVNCQQRGTNPSVFWSQACGGECQRAYVVMLTDGYYNGSTSGATLPSSGHVDRNSPFGAIFSDNKSYTLADYSMYFYNMDLDTLIDNQVQSKLYDDNNRQHLTLFTVSFGVGGNYDPERFPDCLPSSSVACSVPGQNAQCPTLNSLSTLSYTEYTKAVSLNPGATFPRKCPEWWPSGSTTVQNASLIDDMHHAAINSRGAYLNASNPEELIASMETIKGLITQQKGTAAAVTVDAKKIEKDSLLFQTRFKAEDWSGDVAAKCLNKDGEVVSCNRRDCLTECDKRFANTVSVCSGENIETCIANASTQRLRCIEDCPASTMDGEVKWLASEQRPEAPNRQIITADESGNGLPFTWNGLTPSMRLLLTTSAGSMEGNEEHAKRMIAYLRGDTTNEGDLGFPSNFRPRKGEKFGDFINSQALFYSNSTLNIEWVIAGANDGMLHVFDANTGKEEFAFIPRAVFDNLYWLARHDYTESEHRYFVDGNAVIYEFKNGPVVLIGGLGKGGKGYYALNLTAAAQAKGDYEGAAKQIVHWEYFPEMATPLTGVNEATNLNYLGYSYSTPKIINTKATDPYRVAVVGNGYASEERKAALFLFGLDTDGKLMWTHVIDTGAGQKQINATNKGEWNGLGSPALLYPMGDGKDDFVYAGDLLGNMWKFDLSGATRNSWGVYFYDDALVPQPLFQAKSISGWRQPITMEPTLSPACGTGQKGYMVYFGTGRLQGDEDFSDHSYQSVYGIWDWSAQWSSAPHRKYLGALGGYVSSSVAGQCVSQCAFTETDCRAECDDEDDLSCRNECAEFKKACAVNCNSARKLENASNIVGNDSRVTLLRQTQIWGGGINYTDAGDVLNQGYGALSFEQYQQLLRSLTYRPINWYKPEVSPLDGRIRHVGWHFDLPLNGERVIYDMELMNYRLVFASVTPSPSLCDTESGVTFYWAIDSCTGGRLGTPFFDANRDGNVNHQDYLNIGTESEPIYVPISGVGVKGMGTAPVVVETGDGKGMMYFPDESLPTATDVPKIGGSGLGEGDGGGLSADTGANSMMFWSDRKWQ